MIKELELLKGYFTEKLGFTHCKENVMLYEVDMTKENQVVLLNENDDVSIHIMLVEEDYEMTLSGINANKYIMYVAYFLKMDSAYSGDERYNNFAKKMDQEIALLLKNINNVRD